ncbi:MAG TPA: molybdopterin-guanine dinucleotide biosynthesis protein B [Spirochaetota bacterium]|jgi:molybdopterin-guanine dinucleotide biosynthesis protein B|nr:molybdopterin-guanine dinucleotide biosynthesis protein B [Spirochaetota bacterium]OPZ37114.1 MAG: Molybdopterin-guanine dinucleotide biosynthesis adapter protein [Spirochaetes bacterium ADurb.BinA120]HNU91350.1 molybdopterin-guanine dinucleotide biosynthesis protein B [Spirochaetota bacterium]HPI13700.1 molybdopterin-guanine dinucleotide biosynthesis protein B [Spirochaetota bacterium]HPV97797.1 molybdopterin-guanine dinucleotide biosynthesis protein B [Spirochaetota bacterium]
MPFILSIVGRSGSGKTTLIEKLIGHFNERDRKIAIIKHLRHDFDMDRPGKDTWRYREAGCPGVAITNDRECALVERLDRPTGSVEVALRFFSGYDIVLIEGDKEADVFKIEVVGDSAEPPLFAGEIGNIVAVVSDRLLSKDLPCFTRDDASGVGRFIEGLLFEINR